MDWIEIPNDIISAPSAKSYRVCSTNDPVDIFSIRFGEFDNSISLAPEISASTLKIISADE